MATLGTLALDDTLLLNVPELRVMVIASGVDRADAGRAGAPAWITTILLAADLPAAFRAMRSMGVERISAIGGRTIARALTDAGLIQDLYLTTSPRRGGEPDTPLYTAPMQGTMVVRKRGTGSDEGVTFEHLVI